MFEGLRNWWREVKIDADFPKWEQERRAAHLAAAAKRFPTAHLQAEIEILMAPHRERCEEIFGGPIASVQGEVSDRETEIDQLQERIALLEIDHKAQLQPLFERARILQSRWAEVVAEKRQAGSDLESAKDSVDSWYRKSRGTWFGNGGRQLPKHSLFGQSFGDLNGYKDDREDAYRAFVDAKSELNALSEERTELQAMIEKLKRARDRQRQLLEQGLRLPALRQALRSASTHRDEQRAALERLRERHRALLEQAWHRSGAQSVQDALSRAESARRESIDSFDDLGAKERRRREHRTAFRV